MTSGTSAPEPKKQSLGKSSLLMASGTAVSRALGLVRNILLVAVIGATGLTADAFDVANKIPNILYAIIAGGVLNAVIVPQVTRAYRSKNGDEQVDKLLTFSATVLFGLTLVCTLGATLIVALYTSGDWTDQQLGLAVAFGYWCIPQLFFYGIYTLLGQVLNARGQFGPYMWAPALNNVISIIGFAAFLLTYGPLAIGSEDDLSQWTGPKIAVIGISATAGVIAQALVLLIPLYRSGFRWKLRFGLRGFGLRSVGKVGLWTFLALMLDQIAVWVTTRIATAAPGSASSGVDVIAGNASYTQALMVYLLPHSLVTVSVATALFTGMSAAASGGDIAKVRDLVSQGLRVIAVFTVFATALFLVLSLPITKVMIPTLSVAEVGVVSNVLFAMAFGLVPLGAMVMMKWVYFAFEDGKSIFMFQIPVTIVLMGGAYLFTLLLPGERWVFGIGLAMSLSNLIAVILRVRGITERLGGLDVARIVRLHVQLIVAAGISGLGGWLVLSVWGFDASDSFLWAAFICVIVGTVMTALYLLSLQVMKVQELTALMNPILQKVSRR
ncbi:murein biosynthesis integral membrane protein MurJ [Jonesia quinghaiensis]|uniref:murein biosynthesis integral membrane protein MurJ n=1 Tax=Jonesia quinghaiensis TaxID=262806 RepID=UPI0003FC4CFE|nr:murein biosynthesis integral membrane protein MurJ [Jonesia quinghaiensis]